MCTLDERQFVGKAGRPHRVVFPLHRWPWILAAAAAVAPVASLASQLRRDTLSDRVDAIFADVNTTASAGCSLGVIRDGALFYARGYGMANLDDDIALSPSSAFYIASTSKQFTAASILLLAQEGKLSLDDDIHKYVPELPDYGAKVTIRQLIHHTSGLRDYLALMMGLGAGRVENVLTDDDIIRLIARQKTLNFTPGAEYSYSNSGYFLLGVIVKRMSGTSLREYADSHIFRPLGMRHSHFHDDRRQPVRHRVIGYDPPDSGVASHGFRIDFYGNFQGVGDGGLWTTVEDLALWDRNFYDPKVGGQKLLDEQLLPGRLNNGDTISYGAGLMLGRYRGLETVSHGGAFMGYRTEFLRFPGRRFSVICLCNFSTANPTARTHKVADLYLAGEFPVGVVAAGVPADAPSPAPVAIAPSVLRALAGSYRNVATQTVWELIVRDGHLAASGFGITIPLEALSETHFRAASGPPHVLFDLVFEPPRVQVRLGPSDSSREVFERFDRVRPTAAQLAPYAGSYTSSELRVTYTVTVSGDTLFVAIPDRPKTMLRPTVRDAFDGAGLTFTFVRDARSRVTALVAWTSQARNIRFERASATTRS